MLVVLGDDGEREGGMELRGRGCRRDCQEKRHCEGDEDASG